MKSFFIFRFPEVNCNNVLFVVSTQAALHMGPSWAPVGPNWGPFVNAAWVISQDKAKK